MYPGSLTDGLIVHEHHHIKPLTYLLTYSIRCLTCPGSQRLSRESNQTDINIGQIDSHFNVVVVVVVRCHVRSGRWWSCCAMHLSRVALSDSRYDYCPWLREQLEGKKLVVLDLASKKSDLRFENAGLEPIHACFITSRTARYTVAGVIGCSLYELHSLRALIFLLTWSRRTWSNNFTVVELEVKFLKNVRTWTELKPKIRVPELNWKLKENSSLKLILNCWMWAVLQQLAIVHCSL